LNLWIPKERRNSQDFTEIYKMHKGLTMSDIGELFVKDLNDNGTIGDTL